MRVGYGVQKTGMGILAWLRKATGGGDSIASTTLHVVTPAAFDADITPADLGRTILGLSNSDLPTSKSALYTHAAPRVGRILARANAVDALVDQLDGALFYSKIVGVTKRNKRGPSRQNLIEELEEWTELYLFCEPENRHSDHAIRVENIDGDQLGYIPDHTALGMCAHLAKGHRYRCFVSEVTGWEYDTRGVNIALLHWDPVQAARPEREFEQFMSKLAATVGGQWFYAQLIGLTKSNDEGISRRKLFGGLEHKEQLKMITEGDTRETAKYVYLCNAAGAKLGALGLKQSAKVLAAVLEGRRWTAYYRDCTEHEASPVFRPHIALLCLGMEASSQAVKNVGGLP